MLLRLVGLLLRVFNSRVTGAKPSQVRTAKAEICLGNRQRLQLARERSDSFAPSCRRFKRYLADPKADITSARLIWLMGWPYFTLMAL
jgi:hypothetical protein